jgi:hypothetical protein
MLKKLILASLLLSPTAFADEATAADEVNVRCSCGRFLQFDNPSFPDHWETVGNVTYKATFQDDEHRLASKAGPLCRKKYRRADIEGFGCKYLD